MPNVSQDRNDLIDRLPKKDATRLLAACTQSELEFGARLYEPGETTRHVWFPTAGFVSLVAHSVGSPGVEVGMVGREGVLGVHLALGVSAAPLGALVQGGGTAWRIGAAAFKRELAASTALRRIVNLYVCVLMAQQAAAAGCLRFHLINQRLARWLLMSQDRARTDRFPVTHEFLATMLGVRRVGVTGAASALQRSGLIRYHRGDLSVLDRRGLEAAACGCYAADRSSYSALLP